MGDEVTLALEQAAILIRWQAPVGPFWDQRGRSCVVHLLHRTEATGPGLGQAPTAALLILLGREAAADAAGVS